jgi:hypothetical protein
MAWPDSTVVVMSRCVVAIDEQPPALTEAKVDIHARRCLDVRSLIKTHDAHRLKADVADQPGDCFLRGFVVAAEDEVRRRS